MRTRKVEETRAYERKAEVFGENRAFLQNKSIYFHFLIKFRDFFNVFFTNVLQFGYRSATIYFVFYGQSVEIRFFKNSVA